MKSSRTEPGGSGRRSSLPGTGRVAYLVSRYPLTSHTFILREVLALRRRGVEVETFSVRESDPAQLLSEDDRAEFVRTISILPISLVRLILTHVVALLGAPEAYLRTFRRAVHPAPRTLRVRGFFYFAEAVVLWERCHRLGIRHVHAHLANQSCDVALLTTFLGRQREPAAGWWWSFTMHGPTEFFDVERFQLARKVGDADLVVCISEFCRSQLMALADPAAWGKLVVVHCGVDLEHYLPRPADAVSPGAPLRILSVGRLVPEKGQTILLEVVRLLLDRAIDVTLTLAGGGQDARRLEDRAQELRLGKAVTFLGPVSQDAMPELFGEADVFVLASFAEGVPVVLMEAMARALPVVTTAVAGIPELVRDGREGFVVAPGRADLVADALERLTDPVLRARLGQQGRRTVEMSFDSEVCAAELAELFSLTDQRQGTS